MLSLFTLSFHKLTTKLYEKYFIRNILLFVLIYIIINRVSLTQRRRCVMKKMIDIEFGSSRYDELVQLRYKILLEPLGLKFLDMHRDKEAGYLHIGCIESLDDRLVGGLILAPIDNENIRLMQVAVDTRYQGEGIGRDMVKYAEKRAKNAGFKRIAMHAMLSVVNFYEKIGYVQEGEIFEEKGITFAKMVKDLK